MARTKSRPKRGKKKGGSLTRWIIRGVALIALMGMGFAAWLWWDMRSWRPDAALYPEQGAVIASHPKQLNFVTLKAVGAQFVYLRLEQDARALDDDFMDRYVRASQAELKVGVELPFNPCLPADVQSAYFTQMVPRDASLLPPAISLHRTAAGCEPAVSDAAVESELMTLVNQIELHAGKQAILKLGRDFEEQHGTARTTARDLWLERDRARPDYAGRPWLLWSANSQLESEASEEPIEWVVVQR